MPFNIEELDAEIHRLQLIRELANDPKARAALERFVTPDSHKPTPAIERQSTLVREAERAALGKRTYGEMAKRISELLSQTPQSAKEIAQRMTETGFHFATKDAKGAISDVLRNLEKKKAAKRSGTGAYGIALWTN